MIRHATSAARRRWRDVAGTVFGLVVIAAAVLAYVQDSAVQRCERAWFVQVSQAFAERSAATGQSNRDLGVFVDTSIAALSNGEDSERIVAALVDLRDSLAAAEAVRQSAPIPAPPECP